MSRLRLTRRKYLFLECLLRQDNSPMDRQELIRYAWPDDEEVEAASVSVVVARLRREFHGKQMKAQIDPVNRFGYRLIVP
jgi:two-component system, OmpR family, response regulator